MRKNSKVIVTALLFFVTIGSFAAYRGFFSKPYLTVIGVVNMADGLGRQSVEVMETLKDKVSIGFVSTSYPCFKDVPKSIRRTIKNKWKPLGKCILFEESVWTPEKNHFEHLKTKKNDHQVRLAYTMFESSQIPSEWVEILNEYFDAAIVPDPFYTKVYQNSGVEIPIFVLPLGLNLQPFLNEKVKTKPHFPLVFGNLTALIERKNHLVLIEAFHDAFGNSDNVALRLNSRYWDDALANKVHAFIEKNKITNIEFTKTSLSSQDYLDLFKSIDCYVSISKGEGFSIQPREAMALGIPIIVTNNTAQTTLCRAGLSKIVPSNIKEPALRKWGTILKEPIRYGEEYNCTKEDVMEALLDVYDNYDYYLARAENLKSWVKQYDYSNLKPYYLSLIKPMKVCLSTKNRITKNVLYTNSKALYEKYRKVLNVPN
ncbi:MAG: hypothetical protein S4CHLAM37_16040 [Chlamydiia bacterium]|nr:hypothetical protein [Chlamydiia bacterium]